MSSADKVIIFTKNADEFELLGEKSKVELPVDDLRRNLEEFMSAFKDILPAAEKPAAGLGLKTISVALGINGKGQVGFLGTGVEVGGSATLTLTFDRS
ncbi:hypothetical protein IC762_10025 [Bradyrhizobium genosp. L]|uniref:Pepco domain-containing protein n=1 Tax=Bradyrhizobium genosp. L TaxID=83637 RepID=UPI0018A2B069|nr:hypothetical protein [Bradyrhizobium genosp. L]QPF86586.1 hypothetical protein IC762_10025 [Bradyrhizobium genosp. L]